MSNAWKPFLRSWTGNLTSNSESHSNNRYLTLCTYNILNEHFVYLGGYDYCSPDMKSSVFRLGRIFDELAAFGADIVALQEVNYAAMAASGAWERLKAMGYGRVDCPLDTHVSLMTLYRADRLTVLESRVAFMHVLAGDLPGFEPEALAELSIGNYPAQLTALRLNSTDDNRVIVVANLHARWENFAMSAVKRLQLLAVWRAAAEMAARHGGHGGISSCPLALMGDFNSRPRDPPYAMLSGGAAEEAEDVSPDCVKRSATAAEAVGFPYPHLVSAYAAVAGSEPESTSHCVDVGGESWGCLDYVWLSSSGVKPVGALLTPPLHIVKDMPNENFPSDHLPIVVRVELD